MQLDEGFLGEQVPGWWGCWLNRRSMSCRSALVSTSAPPSGSAVIFGNRAMVLQMICASMRRCRVRARRSGWVAIQPSSARSPVSLERAEVSARVAVQGCRPCPGSCGRWAEDGLESPDFWMTSAGCAQLLEEGLERLGGHAAAGADVDGLELAVLEQLIDLGASDAQGVGGFGRG